MKPSEESVQVEPVAAPVATPGARLVQAREQRGLSVDQVSRETNLSPRYVQALESDDYDALPGAAFIRGYLRRYAQLVQLSPDEMVADFDAIWRKRAPAAAVLAEARPATRGPVKVSGLGQASKELFGQGAARISVARILSWGSLALLLLLLVGTLFWNGHGDNNDIDSNDPMTLDMESDVVEPVVPAEPAPAPAVDAAAPVAAPVDGSVPVSPAGAAAVPAPAPAPAQTLAPAPAVAPTAGQPAPQTGVQPAVAPAAKPAAPVAGAPAPLTAAPAATPAAAPAVRPQAPAAPGSSVIPAAPTATKPLGTTAPATTVPVISRPLTPGSQPVAAARPAAATVPVITLPATPVRTGSAPAPATVVPVAPTTTTAVAAPVAPRIDSLSFNFTGKSWISVRDATGQELVYGLKNPGQTVTVTGQAPFSINIGNVNVTTLTRNGRVVSLKPYTRGEIASFRLAR